MRFTKPHILTNLPSSIFFTLALFLCVKGTIAFDGPIKIRRVCLNFTDSAITFYHSALFNSCGTFDSLVIYSRISKTNPDNFTIAQVFKSIPIGNISLKQPDLRQRQYFFRYHNKCDDTSFTDSDTVILDFNPPDSREIDSVSVDIASQKVRIGWTKNPAIDLQGYLVFEKVGVNNVQLTNQANESYLHLNSRPDQSAKTYTYNSYDSCDNKTTLAAYHSTVFLSQKLDVCANLLTLNWTPYVGWSTRIYYIYLNINGAGYRLIDSTSSTTFLFSPAIFGSNHCFFIRAKQNNGTFTSSSNRVCAVIPAKIIPTNTHIKSISVVNSETISIKWFTQTTSMTKDALLYRGTSINNLSLVKKIAFGEGNNEILDNVDTDENGWFYKIILKDSCNNAVDSSIITQSVFLNIDNKKLAQWNSYVFANSTLDENVLQVLSSTWNNIIFAENNADLSITDSGFCYRSIFVSDLGDSSISNVKCIPVKLRFGLPNAININSPIAQNRLFTVLGSGIDWEKTTINIYDRWGGKIFELNNAKKEWDGRINEKNVLTGIYLYTGRVVGTDKSIHNIKGQITIIQ